MSQEQPSQRGVSPHRIPQNVEAASQLIRGVNTVDMLITVMLPAVTVVILMYAGVVLPLGAIGAGVGILAFNYLLNKALPEEQSILYWVKSAYRYGRLPKIMRKHQFGSDDIADDIEIEFLEGNTGGRDPTGDRMFDFIEVEEPTTDMTLVEEVDMENSIVKLTDGSFVTGVTVDGMGMLLADKHTRDDAIMKYKRALNTTDYPITVRATSRQFDISTITDRYESRLTDKDMKERPIMERVMRNKKQFIQQEIAPLGMNTKEYSIIVRASFGDKGLSDGVFNMGIVKADSPVGEYIQSKRVGQNGETPEDELISDLQKRAADIAQGIGRNRQLTADVMEGDELADSLRFFWRREPIEEGEWQAADPVVGSEEQLADAEQMNDGFGKVGT